MRIAVGEILLGEQRPGRRQFLQHGDIGGRGALLCKVVDGFERGQTDHVGRDPPVIQVAAVAADGTVDFQSVFEPGDGNRRSRVRARYARSPCRCRS